MKAGYAYRCVFPCGGSAWRSAPDADWETVMVGTNANPLRGRKKFLGFRSIDGVRCTVWDCAGITYAQSESFAPAPKGLR